MHFPPEQLGGEETSHALRTFDAAKAQCFVPRDREKLLAVVESGFGDLAPFNQAVRELLGVGLSNANSTASAKRVISRRLSRPSLSWKSPAQVVPNKLTGAKPSPEEPDELTEVVPFSSSS